MTSPQTSVTTYADFQSLASDTIIFGFCFALFALCILAYLVRGATKEIVPIDEKNTG